MEASALTPEATLDQAARTDAIIERFRAAGYDDGMLAQMRDYLEGRGSREAIIALGRSRLRHPALLPEMLAVLAWSGSGLDALDQRLLDICRATNNEEPFIRAIAADGPAEEVRDRLVASGRTIQQVLRAFLDTRESLARQGRPSDSLDRVLRSYLPDNLEALVPGRDFEHVYVAAALLRLLLAAPDPPMALVWEIAESGLRDTWGTRQVAPVLLGHDRATFFPRVRAALQRHIADASHEWEQMFALLLAEDWEGRPQFVASLLANRARAVRVAAADWLVELGDDALDALAPLLGHKKADVRALAVRTTGRVGGERADALLLAPRDAERDWAVIEALYEVIGFPWADDADPAAFIAAVVAEVDRLAAVADAPTLPWPAGDAPPLRWATGGMVPGPVVDYVLGLLSRSTEPAGGRHLRQFAAALDRGSAATWSAALLRGWFAAGAPATEAWLLPLVGTLGDARLIEPLRAKVEEWGKGARGAVAARAVHAIALLDDDLALAMVEDLGERVRHKQVQGAAREAIAAAAARRGLSIEELADRTAPRLGFDARGERTLDYGPRRFVAALGPGLVPQLRDEGGKRLASLPKPNAADDAGLAAASQANWKGLRGQLRAAWKGQAARLERALVARRAWPAGAWREFFLRHPLLRPAATTLVWGLLPPGGDTYASLFRPLDDGTLTDVHDDAVELPDDGRVRLAHPLELDGTTLDAWLAHLADYEVTPPFPQLSRPVIRLADEERGLRRWARYEGYALNGGALKGRYQRADWRRGSVQDGGWYHEIWKAFPATGIEAVLETTGMGVGTEASGDTVLRQLTFVRAGTIRRGSYVYDDLAGDDPRAIPLGDVPALVFSEAASDVANFAAAGAYDAEWERREW